MNAPAHPRLIFHALWLSLGAATALGLARFAYALLLPSMKTSLGWTFAQAGGMNSANAAGYLLGALVSNGVITRWTPRQAYVLASVITAVSLSASGGFSEYWMLLALRGLGGLSSAVLFIAGGVLGAQLASHDRSRSGLLLGLYYGGVGIGLMASGVCLPWLLESALRDQWRWAWGILGGLSLLPAVFALRFRLPGLEGVRKTGSVRTLGIRRLSLAMISYGFFGAGYIGYMTFVITALREAGAVRWEFVSAFWGLLGLATFLSSWVWAGLIERSNSGRGLSLLLLITGLGAAIPVVTRHPWAMLVSAMVFGIAFLSVVAATTSLVRKALPSDLWPRGIAAFTLLFALGQVAGPMVSGRVLDVSHSSSAGLGVSVILIGLAALMATLQPKVGP